MQFFNRRKGEGEKKREVLDNSIMRPVLYSNPGATMPSGNSENYSVSQNVDSSSMYIGPTSNPATVEEGGRSDGSVGRIRDGIPMAPYAFSSTGEHAFNAAGQYNPTMLPPGEGIAGYYPGEFSLPQAPLPQNTNSAVQSMGITGQGAMENMNGLSYNVGNGVVGEGIAAPGIGMGTEEADNYNYEANAEGNGEEYEEDDEPDIRWSWKMFPSCNPQGATKCVPLGCMYTPLKKKVPVLSLVGDRCSRCKAFLNPYVRVDVRTQTWSCVMCHESNVFSSRHDSPVTEFNVPLPLQPGHETVEYIEPNPIPANLGYVLLVDLCVDNDEELEGLKAVLKMVVGKLPPDLFVTLITFSITIQLHKLKESKATGPQVASLRGTEEIKQDEFKKFIPNILNYVTPLSECRDYINGLIDELQRDRWPVPKSHRPLRCTGAALSFATTLLELFAPSRGGTIFAFLSGPCTVGPGMIVQPSREFIIRSHRDIKDGNSNATLWFSSCAYYDGVMQRLVSQGHTLSCFCASLDQLGIGELKQCTNASGGVVFNAEKWLQPSFYQSIELFLEPDEDGRLRFAMNASIDVLTSPTWQVAGVVGQCMSAEKMSDMVSSTEIGNGHTHRWITGVIDHHTTYAVYFTIPDSSLLSPSPSITSSSSLRSLVGGSSKGRSVQVHLSSPYRYVQFITRYELDTEVRIRVATVCHPQSQCPSREELIQAFDQEAAAVLLAREAIFRTDTTALFSILRWLDSQLVGVVAAFGERSNQPERPGSPPMRLPPQCVFFPAFMYHLRRSGYLQVFNSSPDETAILRLQLLRSNVRDSIVQIQPTLYRYRMDAPAEPVPLDCSALQPDCVVLLDTFFEVLLHSGSTIAAWRNAGYAEKEEYSFFKEFLDGCLADAQRLVMGRVPVSRLIDACQDDPDARILYNRINPSRSYSSPSVNGAAEVYGQQEGELVYTDDASLQVFMSHLWKLAAATK